MGHDGLYARCEELCARHAKKAAVFDEQGRLRLHVVHDKDCKLIHVGLEETITRLAASVSDAGELHECGAFKDGVIVSELGNQAEKGATQRLGVSLSELQ